jgi:HEAT repeat protein
MARYQSRRHDRRAGIAHMKNRYAFALVIALAAAPAAAQPKGPGPQDVKAEQESLTPLMKLAMPQIVDKVMLEEARRLAEEGKFVVDKMMMFDGMKDFKFAMKDFEFSMPKMDMLAVDEAKQLAIDARFFADRIKSDFAYVGQGRDAEGRDREAELRARERERENELYSQGFEAAGEYKWDRALASFSRVIELKGAKVDAALYWKAYSQNRLGQRAEAIATIGELSKNHPNSRYRKEANVLEAEVRREMGQPVRPQDSTDDEVKLMALQALQNTAPEEAIPLLDRLLEGTASPRVKQRAMFVLAQSRSPRAREVLRNYAKGSSTPELQSQAIRYLGVHGGVENRTLLAEVYAATSDVDVKRMILRSFMTAGDKDRVFRAAQTEQNVDLRSEAVRQLGSMSAHDELWQLYQKESSVDVKRQILRSMQAGGSVDRLIELAKGEQQPELRRDAVRYLGNMRATRTGDVLVQIYNSDNNPEVKKSVINGLFIQENATALVAIARKEQDVNLKKEIVSRLSNMRTKVATDYMMELLGK